MMIHKVICTSLFAVCLSSVSTLAFAKLTMQNNTSQDSTSIINDGMCSSSLPGGIGVTKAHSTNTISDAIINLACWGRPSDCTADVYMTTNCTGDKIATVVMDTKKGIKSVTMHTNEYQITASGFFAQLDGGPALAANN